MAAGSNSVARRNKCFIQFAVCSHCICIEPNEGYTYSDVNVMCPYRGKSLVIASHLRVMSRMQNKSNRITNVFAPIHYILSAECVYSARFKRKINCARVLTVSSFYENIWPKQWPLARMMFGMDTAPRSASPDLLRIKFTIQYNTKILAFY